MVGKNNYNLKASCFCTIVGQEYLFKALSLYNSLNKCSKNFHLWICCIDENVYSILSKIALPDATIFMDKELKNAELDKLKKARKKNEYCWTLKSFLLEYVLTYYNVPAVIYCDSDIYFFSDPEPVFEEWGTYSILLCPQRDVGWVHDKYGYYQAGFIGFKNDSYGLVCLRWWKERCTEWCFAEPDPGNGRWGDQKYLDNIPLKFENIKILNHLGVDAAPWNIIYNNDYKIHTKEGSIYIEDYPLIAYHFACMSIFNKDEYDFWTFDTLSIKAIIKSKIYIPYIKNLRASIETVKKYKRWLRPFFNNNSTITAKNYFKYCDLSFEMCKYDDYYNFCTIVSSKYVIKLLALYKSIASKVSNFHLWVCCVDEASYNIFSKLNLKHLTVMPVKEIEDRSLSALKRKRSLTEYCWTLKAPLILYLLENVKLNNVIYCDADIYFFKEPKAVIDEWKHYATFLCAQRGTGELERIHGRFQAGFMGFRRDSASLDILKWWKKQCLDWCSSEAEPQKERWGDQKYLDKVPLLFISIKIIENPGIDAAPWNLVFGTNYAVSKKIDEVCIADSELVVYHFGSMLIYDEDEYDLWKLNSLFFDPSIIRLIYRPYIYDLKAAIKLLKSAGFEIENYYSGEDLKNAANYFKY